jgi:hypothetical protein
MLLPRFSIRALLALLTVCACAFVVAGMAYRGQTWAWGVTLGIASLLITAAVHATWFGLIWVFARQRTATPENQKRLSE